MLPPSETGDEIEEGEGKRPRGESDSVFEPGGSEDRKKRDGEGALWLRVGDLALGREHFSPVTASETRRVRDASAIR